MKELLHDKRYLILQGLSIVFAVIYLLYTKGYQPTPIWISWILCLLMFFVTMIDSAIKKRWILTSLNLAMVILFFMSLMVLPYGTQLL